MSNEAQGSQSMWGGGMKWVAGLIVVGGVAVGGVSEAEGAAPSSAPPAASRRGQVDLASLTTEQWIEDLDALAKGLAERHIDPFTRCSRESFDAAVAELRGRIPSLSTEARLIALSRIAALLDDSHTSVAVDQFARRLRLLPIRIVWLEDGFFVMAATATHQTLLGRRVLSIGSLPIEEVATRLRTIVASDNDGAARVRFSTISAFADVLQAIGAVESNQSVAIALVAGAPVDPAAHPTADPAKGDSPKEAAPESRGPAAAEEIVTLETSAPMRSSALVLAPDPKSGALPVSRQPMNGNYWFAVDAPNDVVYLRYERCTEDADRPIWALASAILQASEGLKQPRLVIDLRQNPGGNSLVIRPLIDALAGAAAFQKPHAVTVLIGPRTQSSASMNAAELRQRLAATLIGQPTGQRPNHFGELKSFTLPNSGLPVKHSTRYFRPVAGDPEAVMPDVVVPLTSADSFSFDDAAYRAAIALPRD